MADEYDLREAVALVADELGDGTTPRQFTFNSTNYPCAPGDIDSVHVLDQGGYTPQVDVVLVVDKSKLPATPPAEQDVITYESRGLRIVGVQTAPDNSVVVFACVDDSRGV